MFRVAKRILRLPSQALRNSREPFQILPYNTFNLVPRNYFSNKPEKGKEEEFVSDDKLSQEALYDKDGKEIKDPTKEEEDENEDDNSFSNDKKKGAYFFIVAGIGLLGGYAIMQINTMREDNKTLKSQSVNYTGKADIGGSWKLMDLTGNDFGSKNLKGHYYLIYFGFCNCPDICPISLQKVTKALDHIRKMPEYKYLKLKTVFVSVDPDRDSPERISKFLGHFDKSIIGVTGKSNEDPDLKNMMKKFRIYASKIELDEEKKKGGAKKSYTLDHTIITYLMDDSNNYLTHLGSNLNDRDMASTIVDAVLQNERAKAKGLRD